MPNSSTAAQITDATCTIIDGVLPNLTMTPIESSEVTSAVLRAAGIQLDSECVGLAWDPTAVPDAQCVAALGKWTSLADLDSARVRAEVAAGQQRERDAFQAERVNATRSGLRLLGGRERRDHLVEAAQDVLGALRALPVRAADFSAVFADLAAAAGLVKVDGVWQLTDAIGRAVRVTLADLGTSTDDLAQATATRAAELARDRDLIAAFVHDEIHDDDGTGAEAGDWDSGPERGGRLLRLLSDPARYHAMPTPAWAQPEVEPLALIWRMHLAVVRQRQAEQQPKTAAAEAARQAEDRYQHNLNRLIERERRERTEQEGRQRAARWELSDVEFPMPDTQKDYSEPGLG